MGEIMKVMARTPINLRDLELNDEMTLKKQKKILQDDFLQDLGLVIYGITIIIYLYDCSFILLVFRVVLQLVLSIVPKETQDVIATPVRKTISQKVLTTMMVTTGISVMSHIFFTNNIMTDTNDIYSYSAAAMLNFIGERKFSNYFTQLMSLLSLDLLLLFLHFILYSFNYMYKFGFLDEDDEPEISNNHIPLAPVESTGETVKEYDGLTGDLTLFGLDLAAVYKKASSFSRDQEISDYLTAQRESRNSSNGNNNANATTAESFLDFRSIIRTNAANII